MKEFEIFIIGIVIAVIFVVMGVALYHVVSIVEDAALSYDIDVYSDVEAITSGYENLFVVLFSGVMVILTITFFIVIFVKRPNDPRSPPGNSLLYGSELYER